jgi:hypothetical protein
MQYKKVWYGYDSYNERMTNLGIMISDFGARAEYLDCGLAHRWTGAPKWLLQGIRVTLWRFHA